MAKLQLLAPLLTIALAALPVAALEIDGAVPLSWRNLSSPQRLWPAPGAIYYNFNTVNGSKAHVVVVDYKSGKWFLKPKINTEKNATTSQTATATQSSAAVNGGYFNLSDGTSTSFVVIDGQQVADPRTNKALTGNPKLAPYMPQIENRSEVRFLTDAQGKPAIEIVPHNNPLPPGHKLLHSLQAGPQLLPVMREKEEAFLRTDPDGTKTDAISSLRPAARTAFGITPDGYALMVCVAGNRQDPESSGITLAQMADLLKTLGCSYALNFDGGSSSTMFVRVPAEEQDAAGIPPGKVVCSKAPETLVKSVLLLQHH